MKRIIIALVAAVILASSSNSQATVNTSGTATARTPRHQSKISHNGGPLTKTGPNAPRNIRVHAPSTSAANSSSGAANANP